MPPGRGKPGHPIQDAPADRRDYVRGLSPPAAAGPAYGLRERNPATTGAAGWLSRNSSSGWTVNLGATSLQHIGLSRQKGPQAPVADPAIKRGGVTVARLSHKQQDRWFNSNPRNQARQ
jgi:hypothetical protein